MSRRIVALLPMRHESERVPGKNYRDFAGKPLYRHILSRLLNCSLVDEVVVDTDSSLIAKDLRNEIPEVMVIDRPEHLRAGTVPMNEVLLHDVDQIEAEYYLQTHSTNPLLKSETIARAIETFLDHRNENDSLFSVTRRHVRLWSADGKEMNHDRNVLLRTQDLEPVYEENSCLYIFSRKTLHACRNRIGKRPLLFEIDRLEAWDIDDASDFRVAEALLRSRALSS